MTPPRAGDASRDRWAAQIAALGEAPAAGRASRTPITVDRIVGEALRIVEAEGFDALTMRRVASALQTGPASLYAHVRNKAELDDLLIGELCATVAVPAPDPARWQDQVLDVCRQLRDRYLRYPGISRAAFAAVPTNLNTLRISEGLLSILLAAKVPPRDAAWAIDAAFLYVSAYCLELSQTRGVGDADGRVLDRDELLERFSMLPAAHFPNTVAHAEELTAGDGHERFEFTLDLLLGGLAATR